MQDLSPLDLDVAASLLVWQIAEETRDALEPEPEREPAPWVLLACAASVFAWFHAIAAAPSLWRWVWGVIG